MLAITLTSSKFLPSTRHSTVSTDLSQTTRFLSASECQFPLGVIFRYAEDNAIPFDLIVIHGALVVQLPPIKNKLLLPGRNPSICLDLQL